MSDKKKKPQWLGKLLKYGIPLIVSAGLCYLLFMGIDYREMLDVVRRQCNFNWLLLMMAIAVLSHVCRAARWRIQLKALHVDAPFYVLIYSIFGTYAVNLVFPRLGEIWRTGYIAQRQNARFTTVFGSMVADRLADTVTVVLILCLTLLVASGPILDYLSRNGETFAGAVAFLRSPWLWCVFVLCAAAAWLLLTVRSNLRWINVVQKVVKDLWAGFAVVFHMPGTLRWLLFSAGIWGCYFLQMYVSFYAFPFTAELLSAYGVAPALVAFTLSSISMGVPSNGGIGPWQWAVIFALGIYGTGQVEAAAFANLVLGCNTLLLVVLGIITFAGIALDRRRTAGINNKEIRNNK